MNLIEYHKKYRSGLGGYPDKGMCHIIKQRGSFGPDCVKCQNFYVEDREQWLKELTEKLRGTNPPLNIYCWLFTCWLLQYVEEAKL